MVDIGNVELDGLTGNDFVSRIREFDEHFMRSGQQSNENDGLAAGVYEVPWGIIHSDMDVTDSRGH